MSDNTEVHDFDADAVSSAIASAQSFHQETMAARSAESGEAGGGVNLADSGELFVQAQCISVTVSGGKICLNLPLRIGRVCLPIPSFVPNGTAAQACIGICTTWGIPTGVRVTVSVAGRTVVSKTFGKC